jgi:predicted ribosome quality control (RQC) complex YloA/Tae2 family protein
MALFREFDTSSGKQVFVGRDAENNEELVKQINNNEFVLHTARPGSPFVNIKSPSSEVSKEDIKEASVFCAKYSQDWRDNKKDVVVHIFLGKDISKGKDMKQGTFGVKSFKEIKVRKEDVLEFEKMLAGK